MTTTTATTDTKTLKFVRVADWYAGLPRYEAEARYSIWNGKFVIEAVPSDVYEGRISSWTVKYVPQGMLDSKGRQIGSINTRFGKGEIKFVAAKNAARDDFAAWKGGRA